MRLGLRYSLVRASSVTSHMAGMLVRTHAYAGTPSRDSACQYHRLSATISKRQKARRRVSTVLQTWF